MDKNTKEVLDRWLVKAENDLRTAESVLEVSPPIVDTACFHAQQCVEKLLKAVLTAQDRHVERTHSLPRLLELAGRTELERLRETCVALTDYAVAGRYPDDWRDIQLDEAKEAVVMASQAREQILKILKPLMAK